MITGGALDFKRCHESALGSRTAIALKIPHFRADLDNGHPQASSPERQCGIFVAHYLFRDPKHDGAAPDQCKTLASVL